MVGKKCAVCNKTAYPIESLREGDQTWHKLCFRCSVCKGTLTIKNFKTKDQALYCATHYPSEHATAVADDVTTRHAQNAPQKKAEGLATV
jgi:LIM and SH3 domain protein 1